jgi:hypothetical protein
MCFVFIWEQTATCATYRINWLVFITEMKCVYCAVRTGSLNKAVCASYLKILPGMSMSCCSFVRVRYYRGGDSHFLVVTGGYKRFGGSFCFCLQFCREPKDKSLLRWGGLWFQCWHNLTRCLGRFITMPTYRWAVLRHITRSVCARKTTAEKLTFRFMLCGFVTVNWRSDVLANYRILR